MFHNVCARFEEGGIRLHATTTVLPFPYCLLYIQTCFDDCLDCIRRLAIAVGDELVTSSWTSSTWGRTLLLSNGCNTGVVPVLLPPKLSPRLDRARWRTPKGAGDDAWGGDEASVILLLAVQLLMLCCCRGGPGFRCVYCLLMLAIIIVGFQNSQRDGLVGVRAAALLLSSQKRI